MNAHIYLVTNKLNGKHYVGQTTVSKNKYGHGEALKLAYDKYGKKNFNYEIICNGVNNRNTLNFMEKFWIKVMDSRAPNGYNIEEGGTTKGEISESTRQKLREKNKGKIVSIEVREKLSKAGKGRKHSPKTIEKMKLAAQRNLKLRPKRIGIKLSEETKKKLSEMRKGELNPFYGKKHSEETKAKFKNRPVSRYWAGKKRNEEDKAHLIIERTCPYCQKIGKGNAMIGHINKCKVKE